MDSQIFCTSCVTDVRFDGTAEEAADAGWCENEFGWVCPECADLDLGCEDGWSGFYPYDVYPLLTRGVLENIVDAEISIWDDWWENAEKGPVVKVPPKK